MSRLPVMPLADTESPTYDYHGDYTRKSATMLKVWMDSHREYEAIYVLRKKPPKPSNKAMDVGSVVHEVFLEGADVGEIVLEAPAFALNKEGGWIGKQREMLETAMRRYQGGEALTSIIKPYPKYCITPGGNISDAKSAPFRRNHPGDHYFLHPVQAEQLMELLEANKHARYVMKRDDIETAKDIVERICDEPDVIQWLQHPDVKRETPIFWSHKVRDEGGEIIGEMPSRCQPDFIIPVATMALFFDLKITVNWSPEDFGTYLCGNRRGGQRGWLQLTHYTDGIIAKYDRPTALRFVAVSPECPHQLCVNRVSEQTYGECRSRYEACMRELFKAEQSGDYSEPFEGDDNVVSMSEWEIC